MAITDLQRDARSKGLGSSDVAAILGFSPWRTAADVRLEKLGMVEREPAGELAEIGLALEPAIAALAAKRLNCKLVKPSGTFVHDNEILRANVDRQVERYGYGQPIVELKDSGLDDDWGEPGTDQVPAYVLIQVVVQMVCAKSNLVHIARLGRGFRRGLTMYHVTPTDGVKALAEAVQVRAPQWWKRHIVEREPLPATDEPPSLDLLQRIKREPKSSVPVDKALVLDWIKAQAEAKRAKDLADAFKARVIDAMGPAESGICEGGMVTFLEQGHDGYTVQPTRYRVLRWKPGKKPT